MSYLKILSKFSLIVSLSIWIAFLCLNIHTPVYSNEVDELEDQIEDINDEINSQKSVLSQIEKKISEISNSKYSLSEKVNLLNNEIKSIQEDIDKKDSEIDKKLKEIEDKQKILSDRKELLDTVSADLYIQTRYSGEEFFLDYDSFDTLLKNIFIKRSAVSILQEEIAKLSNEYTSLADLKSSLEKEKKDLDAQKEDLDESYDLLVAERNKVQAELNKQYSTKSQVTSRISKLNSQVSQLQEALVLARAGGTSVNPDSVPNSGDYYSSLAGFKASAPSGSFAVFSIGAYTHRNGMSQWGARARADAGQTYTQILNAYYFGKKIRTNGTVINKTTGASEAIMTKIKTTTYGTLNFEDDYLLRLGEVPESWPMEVLKAQAIAARTYAINYTNNGRSSICTTESCQVIGSTKKTGAWKTAVQATRGIVLTDSSGKVFSTQYAAVHGGWINNVGWDTTDGSGSGDWMARAWDSKSGVSWFYKSWYRDGYSNTSDRCGRYSWLSQAEMSDILNAYLVMKGIDLKKTPDISRVIPITYNDCPASRSGGNPYSLSEMKALINNPVTSISLAVTSNSSGTTKSVTFYTNRGTITMSGLDFKDVYNVRAPGYLRIPQNGFVHINVEKK